LSLLNSLIKKVDDCFENLDPTRAGRLISTFVNDNLSNWYVRLNRKRFWGGEQTQDKLSAYQTLYTCLETVAKLMAPIAPFYADRLYQDLTKVTGRDGKHESVHLALFPVCDDKCINKTLEAQMQVAQDITSMVLALRRKVMIKVRQPLQCIMIPCISKEQRAHIEAVKDLIKSEVNVKEVKFVDNTDSLLVKKVKLDFKKLGPKFGKNMKALAQAVAQFTQADINDFERNGSISLTLNGAPSTLLAEDVTILNEDMPGWLVANEGNLTVALEVTLTDALVKEGIARELVNRIQNLRKQSGFEITDKIRIQLSKNAKTNDAVTEYNQYICGQVLGLSLELTDEVKDGTVLNFDDFDLLIKIEKN
jgi:isoleucyl-tRNA synthetase